MRYLYVRWYSYHWLVKKTFSHYFFHHHHFFFLSYLWVVYFVSLHCKGLITYQLGCMNQFRLLCMITLWHPRPALGSQLLVHRTDAACGSNSESWRNTQNCRFECVRWIELAVCGYKTVSLDSTANPYNFLKIESGCQVFTQVRN